MVYQFLLCILIMVLAVACSDSASRGPAAKQSTSTNATLPKLPPNPIQRAAFTVGTLPQSSGASPAGEYGIELPLDVPDGRVAMAPMLSLGYSSGAGVDNAGLGWSLRGASSFIRVCAPPFASRGFIKRPDSFCLDQQVLVSIAPGEWHTENESFAKIVSMPVDAAEPTSWEVWAKDGRIRTYAAVKYDGSNIRFWALASERDRIGNRIDYFYRHEETAPFTDFVFDIERIEYTASASKAARRKVEFRYKPSDTSAFVRVWDPHAQAYHRRDISGLLTSIDMFGPNENGAIALAWSYSLAYERSADTDRPLLSSIERCGALGGCLQARTFTYSARPPGTKDTFSTIWEHVRNDAIPREQIRVLDANGDGKDDVHIALGLYNSTTFISADPAQAITSTTIPGPDAVPVDIDGDGKVELVGTRTLTEKPLKWEKWIYRADVSGRFAPWKKLPNTDALWSKDPYVTGYNALYTEIFELRFGDVDGDQLPDLCRARPAYTLIAPDPTITAVWRCAKNFGDGTFGTWDLAAHIEHAGDGPTYLTDRDGDGKAEFHNSDDVLGDLDGDGLLEVAGSGNAESITVGDFDDDGRDDIVEDNSFLQDENSLQDVGVFRGDFDGNGRDDLLKIWIDSAKRTHFKAVTMRGGDPDRLIEVGDEGSEWRERITYMRSYAPDVNPQSCVQTYPLACVRRGSSVVARIQSRTGMPRDRQFSYGEPIFDRQGRGFLGYRFVQEWEPDRPQQTTTYFDNAAFNTSPQTNKRVATGAFRPRRIVEVTPIVEHPVGGGAPAINGVVVARVHIHETTSQVDWLNGGKTYFIHPSVWHSWQWETGVQLNASTWPHIVEPVIKANAARQQSGTLSFDGMGNLRASTRQTMGGTSEASDYTYDIRVNDWLVGLPQSNTVTSTDVSGVSKTRHVQFVNDAVGLLETIEIEKTDPAAYQKIHYVRDNGLVVEETRTITANTLLCPQADGCPRTTHAEYDDEGVFATKTWNTLGHTQWTITYPSLGVPMAATDENGVLVQWVHDDLGRMLQSSRDGGSAVSLTHAPWVENGFIRGLELTSQSSDNRLGFVHVDDRGRTIEQRARGFDGEWSQVTPERDVLDRIWRVNRPAAIGADLNKTPSTTTQFDSLDRMLVATSPNGAKVTAGHSMFGTTTVDSLARERAEIRDNDGRTIETIERVDISPPLALPWDRTYDHLHTHYAYGPFEQLKTLTDPNGNVTHMHYDVRGNRNGIIDPDAGTRSSQYNGHGELMRESIAGDVRTYERDVLGRVKTLQTVDGISQWVYDTQKAGTLSQSISASGVKTDYHYDDLVRLDETSWTVNGEVFKVSTTYDGLDRPDTVAYPEVVGLGRTTIQQRYNAFGDVERIDDVSPGQPGTTLWAVKDRNRDGALLTSVTGDGLTTTNAYNAQSGMLEDIRVHAASGADLYHVGMLHDDAGRLQTRTDYVKQRDEQFANDDLSRLKSWHLTTPTVLHKSAYAYDRVSNLEKVTRDGAIQQQYTHGNNGRPHAILDDGKPLGFYSYDQRGRVINGGGRSITYTDFDLPANVTTNLGTTFFQYDASNQRVSKTSVDEQTIYTGGLYERRESVNGMVHIFHVAGIADIVYQAGAIIPRETLYLHGDALGSTSLVTDAKGNERERLYYAPFGARVDIDGNPPTGPPSNVRDGFTGHRHDDELGLIDMRGRIFDTKTSRFPTPDPFIADPTFSPSLNRFAYVHQSPLNWTDPTGFNPKDPQRGLSVWEGSVHGGAAIELPSTGIGVGTVDPGLAQDVAAGIAGMFFPAGSDAVNSSGCPTGTGKTPRPCAGASQGGCPSGNAQTDSWSLTNSWGFRFAKGAAVEKATNVATTVLRVDLALTTMGGSELAIRAYQHGSAVYAAGEKGGVGSAIVEHFKQSIPLLGVYDMGENFVHTIEEGDPEKIGAASLPVFEGVVGMVAGGKLAGVGKTSVYRSRNAVGETQYVGVTRAFWARQLAHRFAKRIDIEKIRGLTDLSLADARAVEQVLIEHHGLGKNGGTLLNKINGIAQSNPVYSQALSRGTQLLRDVGYPGF